MKSGLFDLSTAFEQDPNVFATIRLFTIGFQITTQEIFSYLLFLICCFFLFPKTS